MDTRTGKIILSLSVPLSILIVGVSATGIFYPHFYAKETLNWQVQSVGQDIIDLVVVAPVLIITGIMAYRKNNIGRLLWAGTIMYILYTFIIYCFDVHFNRLFVIYCLTLGLSFYSLAWFVFSQIKNPIVTRVNKTASAKVTAAYFFIISFVFYFLWLSEIGPAIFNDTVPRGLIETALPTNPVQVIDLAVFLPGIFIAGLLLLKGKPVGFTFAIIILSFFILMNISIGWLAYMMQAKGLTSNLVVTVIMAALSLISVALLVWNIKSLKNRIV
jgi:hypothetical protein